jgi:cytoskeleton protein RodZ
MTDIGAMLREARMREHRDIAEFEERTKIRAKYLRALEDEEWGLLPGYTFAKAFLRTYADMLGLDGRMLVDEFKRQYQDPSELELAPVLPSRGEGRRSRERPSEQARDRDRERGRERERGPGGPSSRVLLVALLVVLIAAALFVVHELRKKSRTPAHTTTSHTVSTPTTPPHARTVRHKVALALFASAPVRICLIGYRTHSGGAQERVNAVLDPGAVRPVYHADNHFLVSFDGGAGRMVIDGRSIRVAASTVPVSFEIFLSGHFLELPAGSGPHCT